MLNHRRNKTAIIIGADKAGQELKEVIKDYLKEGKYEVVDVSENEVRDFVDTTLAVAKEVNASEDNLGIVIDAYGVGSFMVATKIKGMVAAEVSDERSAYMTRGHNNARIITLGSEISAPGIAKNIIKGFVEGKYDGGRHQVRVDMLNKMC
ncbi:TPA: galactose-6-phosphate isomerase subunit LacA [Streptococcus pyogenes MGAS9983]|nr:galactose-6-phosphate isomerase subunit LacA [Streptococcus pyogenes MGAS9955]HER5255148.1 galactose-6-phosphate isomerase subunit LacA [Streptococcus pyogenes MGAS9983]HER5283107.1 galactose-6-phosphate isomerase subunit LacA [Streptococcus pyogenes MGAS9986]HER5287300.1 galactose-6-phosphate isomerase subunit LacA [Streptococcus pyogenes MGAS9892]